MPEIKGHCRFWPYEQIRLCSFFGPRKPQIGIDCFGLKIRIPLYRLTDIALDNHHAFERCRGKPPINLSQAPGTVPPVKTYQQQADSQRHDHKTLTYVMTLPRVIINSKIVEKKSGIYEYDQKGDAVSTQNIGNLNHRQHGVLAVPDDSPGKSGKCERAKELEGNPQGRDNNQAGRRAESQPRNHCGKQGHKNR